MCWPPVPTDRDGLQGLFSNIGTADPHDSGDSPVQVQESLAVRIGQVVQSAVQVLGVDSVGLMLMDETGALSTAAFTDQPSSAFEETQVRLDEGPGIDTSRTGQVVTVADLGAIPAYLNLWNGVADLGIRAVVSCPVWVRGGMMGNFNVTRADVHEWSAQEVQAAEAFAGVVGVTLDLAARTADTANRVQNLQRAGARLNGDQNRSREEES